MIDPRRLRPRVILPIAVAISIGVFLAVASHELRWDSTTLFVVGAALIAMLSLFGTPLMLLPLGRASEAPPLEGDRHGNAESIRSAYIGWDLENDERARVISSKLAGLLHDQAHDARSSPALAHIVALGEAEMNPSHVDVLTWLDLEHRQAWEASEAESGLASAARIAEELLDIQGVVARNLGWSESRHRAAREIAGAAFTPPPATAGGTAQ